MTDQIPEFARFDHDDAWKLGCLIVEKSRAENLTITASIRLGEQIVFHVGLPGSSADLDHWVERKSNIVYHFRESSKAVGEKYIREGDFKGFYFGFALAPEKYFPSSGAVPIFVGGALAGVVALSGVDGPTEHRIALTSLQEYAAKVAK